MGVRGKGMAFESPCPAQRWIALAASAAIVSRDALAGASIRMLVVVSSPPSPPPAWGPARRFPDTPLPCLCTESRSALPPLTHRHLGLPRRIVIAPLQLKIAILITHHPIVGNAPLGFQAEHLFQFPDRGSFAVIVLPLLRLACETPL